MTKVKTSASGVRLQTLSVDLPVETYQALKGVAVQDERTVSQLIRLLVNRFLAENYWAQQPSEESFQEGAP